MPVCAGLSWRRFPKHRLRGWKNLGPFSLGEVEPRNVPGVTHLHMVGRERGRCTRASWNHKAAVLSASPENCCQERHKLLSVKDRPQQIVLVTSCAGHLLFNFFFQTSALYIYIYIYMDGCRPVKRSVFRFLGFSLPSAYVVSFLPGRQAGVRYTRAPERPCGFLSRSPPVVGSLGEVVKACPPHIAVLLLPPGLRSVIFFVFFAACGVACRRASRR